MRYRYAFYMGIAICLLTSSAIAQRQWVRFDNGVQTSPGLSFLFQRSSVVYDDAGALVGIDTPRWRSPTLLCAFPEFESLRSGLSINAIAAGYQADGVTPLYVINTATNQRLSIHFGKNSVEKAFRDNIWDSAYVLLYKDENKNNIGNLLLGQTGNNNGTPDIPGMAFSLTNGATVYNGLIILGCEVLENAQGQWNSRRVALAYSTVDRLPKSDPWIIAAVGEQTNPDDTSRGSPWSLSVYPISENELIVVWTDYRTPVKTGGICYATRFTKIGNIWTPLTIRIDRSDQPVFTEHWHTGGLIVHNDGRQSILISTGDSIPDNRLIARTLAAGGIWASTIPIADTGIDQRSRIYEPSNDWTSPATVWGRKSYGPLLRHNQAISMVPADAACSALFCGTDETSAAVLKLEYDPDSMMPSWTTLFLPTITSWPGDGVLNFSMHGMPGGPYLGRIDAAGTSDWQSNQRETRILFSPNGLLWGEFFVAGTSGNRQAVIVDDTAYIGSLLSNPAGLRRLSLPNYTTARPMAFGSSHDNLMRKIIPIPTKRVDQGVTISRVEGIENLPAGVPPPPCEPNNVFLITNHSAFGKLGLWNPVSDNADVPAPEHAALLRAWVYAIQPVTNQDSKTTAQIALQFADGVSSDHMSAWTNQAHFDAGAWMPITVWGSFIPLDTTGSAPELAWLPQVYLRAERQAQSAAQFRFLIAWEGVYNDSPTVEGNGLPSSSSGSSESAAIEGLTLGDTNWTIYVQAMVPPDQWDNRVGGSSDTGLLTSSAYQPQLLSIENNNGSQVLKILADPQREGLITRIENGNAVNETNQAHTIYWERGSPVYFIIRSEKSQITVDYSVGGSVPRTMSFAGTITPERIRLGPDALDWFGIEAVPYVSSDAEVLETFKSMSLHCAADIDDDGDVDTQDVILFLNAWNIQGLFADFNHDGIVDTADLIDFLNAFAAGC